MYNDKSISLVLTGASAISSGSLHNTLAASKPILGANPAATADLFAKNAYYLGPGPFGQSSIATYLIDVLRAKKVALIGPAFVGTALSIKQLKQAADPAGVTVTAGTYKQGSADVAPAVLASKAQSADVVLVLEPNQNGCTAVAKALGDLPTWTFPRSTIAPTTSAQDSSGEAAVYLGAMQEYQPDSTVWGLAPSNFSALLYAVKILNKVGPDGLTPEKVSSAIAGDTGPVFLASPDLKFGGPQKTIGSTAFRFYTYKGKGSWASAADGKWLT